MSTPKILAGKRIAVLAADGFEQAQLDIPLAALADGGAAVTLVSLRRGRIRGMHLHQPGELVRIDEVIATAQAADHDGLFIPGGYVSPDALRQSAPARAFVREFDMAAKPIAVLAQAPLVLVSAGLAAGRTLAAWPGIRDDLVNAGATWRNDDVVRDAHVLSGRGAHDLAPFVQAMKALFAGERATAATAAQSDPPQDSPLEQPNQSLRWLAAPSFGTMLSLALLGVGVVAAQRVRHRQAAGDPPAPAASDASARARD